MTVDGCLGEQLAGRRAWAVCFVYKSPDSDSCDWGAKLGVCLAGSQDWQGEGTLTQGSMKSEVWRRRFSHREKVCNGVDKTERGTKKKSCGVVCTALHICLVRWMEAHQEWPANVHWNEANADQPSPWGQHYSVHYAALQHTRLHCRPLHKNTN